MAYPLGHLAIGLTTFSWGKRKNIFSQWRLAVLLVFLANLPDIDVLIGLLWQGNGTVFHRGPTHSLVFAAGMGYLATRACCRWPSLPQIGFVDGFLVIASHLVADYFLTTSPISFLWPFDLQLCYGHTGWADVAGSIFRGAYQEDAVIVAGCCGVLILNMLIHKYPANIWLIFDRFRAWAIGTR